MLWISAVSSPQTNAPAPILITICRAKPVPRMSDPSKPACSACPMARRSLFDRQRVFGPDVDVCLAGPDGVSGDDHAFHQTVGIAFNDRAVHEGAGIPLVRVADQILLSSRPHRGRTSTSCRSGKPPPPRPRNPLARRCRTSAPESACRAFGQGAVPASCDVLVDARRIDDPAVGQHPARLRSEERMLVQQRHVRP